MFNIMENFHVCLSRNDIDLLLSCLSSCTGQCFLAGNNSLALDYIQLYNRLQSFVL